jgi:hypothetical protein
LRCRRRRSIGVETRPRGTDLLDPVGELWRRSPKPYPLPSMPAAAYHARRRRVAAVGRDSTKQVVPSPALRVPQTRRTSGLGVAGNDAVPVGPTLASAMGCRLSCRGLRVGKGRSRRGIACFAARPSRTAIRGTSYAVDEKTDRKRTSSGLPCLRRDVRGTDHLLMGIMSRCREKLHLQRLSGRSGKGLSAMGTCSR